MKKRQLGKSSVRLTEVGLGASSLGNLYQVVSDQQSCATVETSWNGGIRYFDTAPYYGLGLSEWRLGRALNALKRDDYVVSTKVGRLLIPSTPTESRYGFVNPLPNDFVYDYSYDGIMRSYESSRQRLGLDKIDVLLVHDIGRLTHGADNDHQQSLAWSSGYRALDELRSSGAVQAIGLGVNEIDVCIDALNIGQWDCFLLAGRYTLLEQGGLEDFLPRCIASGTSVIVGGIYNSGILATGTKAKPLVYDYGAAPQHIVERVKRIEDVCASHAVPLPLAALHFPLFHPAVTCVVPGTGKPERIADIIAQYHQVLPSSLWSDLKSEGLIHPLAPTKLPSEAKR